MTTSDWWALGAALLMAIVCSALDAIGERRRREHFLMTGRWL